MENKRVYLNVKSLCLLYFCVLRVGPTDLRGLVVSPLVTELVPRVHMTR